jgi:hypothetical protein
MITIVDLFTVVFPGLILLIMFLNWLDRTRS